MAAEDPPGPADAVPAAPPRASATVEGRRVLVLDDEESIRSLLEEGLGLHGLRVTCAASSDEAARLAVTENFDVLLCDLNLGGMGGAVRGAPPPRM